MFIKMFSMSPVTHVQENIPINTFGEELRKVSNEKTSL